MKKDLLVEEVKHVAMSQVMPEEWHSWIFYALSENAPFSWGDNNMTLIHADRFMDHLVDTLDLNDQEKNIEDFRESIIDTLKYLSANNIYVDLES
jgi:hypothetical protein